MAEAILIVIAVILMLLAIIASVLPFIPGPALVWGIGFAFAALTDFTRITWFPLGIMTILMLLGMTSGWWAQVIGMKSQGGSCMSIIGALAGGLIGTFVIAIPFLGTLAGMVIGAVLFEFAKIGEFKQAMQSGSITAASYLLGIVLETGISLLILLVFALTLITTG